MRGALVSLFALASLVACEPRDTDVPTTDANAAQTQIEEVRDSWIASAERDDAASVASLYTDDAVLVGADGRPAEGRQAIQRSLAEAFPAASGLRVTSREMRVSGDLAYDYGEFSQQVTPPGGQPMQVTGAYLVVLRRQDDGTWRITKHLSATPQPQPGG